MRKRYVEIKVRPTSEAQKARFEKAARASGRSLSKWLLAMADAALAKGVS